MGKESVEEKVIHSFRVSCHNERPFNDNKRQNFDCLGDAGVQF